MKKIGLGIIGIVFGAALPAAAVNVTVLWNSVTTNVDGSSLSDLGGYRLYHSTRSFNRGGFLTPAQAQAAADIRRVSAGQGATSMIVDLAEGATHYLRLTAFDTSGNESGFNVGSTGQDVELTLPLFGVIVGPDFFRPAGLKEAYVFPNPSRGNLSPRIRADMGGVEKVDVTVFDQAGKSVLSDSVTETTLVDGTPVHEYVVTQPLASGIYYVVLHGRKGAETVRARAAFAVVQ